MGKNVSLRLYFNFNPFCDKIQLIMRHRIFIAINLPEKIRMELSKYKENWPELPVRWTKKDNLHITLIFFGYLLDEELLEIFKITKEVAARNQSFLLNLSKICYGPPEKMPPKMVWVQGEKSREFASLKDDIEKSLGNSERVSFSPEKRVFSPHITLGRIRTWEFRQLEIEERPEISEDISLSFEVNSIEIMESHLKRRGPEYTIIESCPFKENF